MLKKIKKAIQAYLPNSGKEQIPVIRLEGVIGSVKSLGKKGISLETVKKALQEAFDDERVNVVALVINSPGGSPVQSSLIYKYICHLKKQKNKKVIAFVEDVAASGGYYIACCADEIYSDNHSIIGSIGVVSGGFGFTEAIKKIGVERRIYTSGESKAMLDPFLPENPEHIGHLKTLQEEVHQGFKDVVIDSRKDKLQNHQENEIFTGKFWSGKTALSLGLIDGIDSLTDKMFALYGDDYKLIPIETDKKGFLEKFAGIHAETVGAELRYTLSSFLTSKI